MQQRSSFNVGAALGFGVSSERRLAMKATLVFVACLVAWKVSTDLLVRALVDEPAAQARAQTAKAWVFAAVAATLVYVLTRRLAATFTRAKRAIAAVLESINEGVLVLGRERTVLHANPAALRMLHASLPELMGLHGPELVRRFRPTNLDGSALMPPAMPVEKAFREQGPVQGKMVVHPPGQEERVLLSIAAPVRSALDELEADLVVSVMHDVTALERFERMRDEFISVAAHSLKTPVAILKSSLHVVRQRDGREVERPLSVMERQIGRLEALTENLLVLARLRAGALQLYPVELELRPLIARVAADTARLRPGHALRVDVPRRMTAFADPERLALALRNVVDEVSRAASGAVPLTLVARDAASELEVGVRYEPRVPGEPVPAYDRFNDLGMRRYVTRAVAHAHGGFVRDEADGRTVTTWLRLPGMEVPDGDRR